MKDLYEILNLERRASSEDVKRAYYALAKMYHPDSKEQADVKKFYEVTEAYQILSDEARRKAYDETLKTGRLEKSWMESDESVEVQYGRLSHEESLEYRMHELNRYRRRVFWNAAGKVFLGSIVGGFLGNALALILGGSSILGFIAGAFFAFAWAFGSHFDLESFIPDPRRFKRIYWAGRTLQAFALLYFLGLFLYHLFR